jgi:hypothetical protein
VGTKSFFSLTGLEMLKNYGFESGSGFAPNEWGAEPFFLSVGLAKLNSIIFYTILQTRRARV